MGADKYPRGQVIPGTQYRCVRLLGEGGFGSVYLVEHTFLESRAVLKTLHAHLVDRADVAERMHVEAKTLAKIQHPNVVEVRDGGITAEKPPRPYFVMEYLNGHTLAEVLRDLSRGIGLKSALDIIVDVLDGLDVAHTKHGVIHRDIKPANIFLHRAPTDHTVPKILDFGIAHVLSAKRMTGEYFLGTHRYGAPE